MQILSKKRHTKFIFVTGGVVSSLGKGIVSSSLGALLETRGLKVSLSKADPYINIDPGTMSPSQHGEVFVTRDGAETDLDIGHYERFTHAVLTRFNSFSAGKIYDDVLSKERKGVYLGMTVQVVPHITAQIKEYIYRSAEGSDLAIIEIGGTVGDIESLPFLETIRQIRYDLGPENVLSIHVTLLPYIDAAKELKTKPTQHSVKELRSIGIQPDILVCRANHPISQDIKKKIALFCNVAASHVIESVDVDNIYKMPLIFHAQGLDQIVVEHLNIWTRKPELQQWHLIVDRLNNPKRECTIAVVGKYTDVIDSYKSISEALVHAGIANQAKVKVAYIDASDLEQKSADKQLEAYDGIIVPGGFGERGVEGKIAAVCHARTQNKPFLGICLGMQLAAIEFARNVLGLTDANSFEFKPNAAHVIVHPMPDQTELAKLGGTMRLGAYPCEIKEDTKAFEAYKQKNIQERHRHRYEFNNEYRLVFEERGFCFSGLSPDHKLVEIVELKDHPWFVASQFHPELQSKPMEAHPLFSEFIRASLLCKEN
ncbi:MAG: CTP synthase [Oligoflexales bacterium]|nr:CTP synthase [Oligoflexales bacterium]